MLAATAVVAGVTATGALAANQVDGSISALGETCSWVNATTSADPPAAATIDRASVNAGVTCTGGVGATLNNDPIVTFDDVAGTATGDAIDATVTTLGQTCRYRTANAVLTRSGDTRSYSTTINGVPLVSGSFFCPGSVDLTATISFH